MLTPSQELIERVAELEYRVGQALRHLELCRVYGIEPNAARLEAVLGGYTSG